MRVVKGDILGNNNETRLFICRRIKAKRRIPNR